LVAAALVAGGLVLANRDTEEPAPPGSSPSLGASVSATVAPPGSLEAKATAVPLGVTLSWTASADAVQGYRVYRGESQIATVPPITTTYTDTAAQPGNTYTYGVVSRGSGPLESDPLSVVVEVPVPPLSKARLDGDFNVNVKVTSASGYTDYAKKFKIGWEFTPRCSEGPCDVKWKDLSDKDFRATLKRSGATYKGSDSGPLNARCGDTVVTSKLEISFKVVKAKAIEGAWTATKIRGTIVQTEKAQLGCVSTRLDQAIMGTRLS
jgi:fibronectin type 3 domain-containing protein